MTSIDNDGLWKRTLRLPAAIWRRVIHNWALFRARTLSLARAGATRPRRLLIMCYGNIYRSPFVAATLKSRLAGQAGFEIRSAGFHGVEDRSSPPEYVQLVRAHVDLGTHRSRRVTPADLQWAEAIVIMDRFNWERLRPFGVEIQQKIIWLGAFGDGPVEVEDPYGRSPASILVIVRQMIDAAEGLTGFLLGSVRPVN